MELRQSLLIVVLHQIHINKTYVLSLLANRIDGVYAMFVDWFSKKLEEIHDIYEPWSEIRIVPSNCLLEIYQLLLADCVLGT